ncbi:IPT/TIG domain-containing protein [Streptomyces albireticuli]|nr:IPT/TIG domain-containing protein [Streptomyces albireticuli]MCD9145456.1 IPT/TIG domain-containing protein [Streptomyces albireticuli]MCD9164979.1 IPT/TIG domain-containing protein [Streptomyces albireticuli]MCD9195430.1 IPT/TIG domain-containing protein [Streptomyces albireticuli]
MSLQIDSIDPAQGKQGDQVTLTGTLLRAQALRWGEEEWEEGQWEGGGSKPGEAEIYFTVPEGEGTIQVVAVNGDEQSNAVEFTYV